LPGQAKKKIIAGDILFSEIRPANGRYAPVTFDSNDYVVSTKFMVLQVTSKDVYQPFFLIQLTSDQTLLEFQRIAESRSGTFPQITFDAISYYPFSLPPLPEQKAIAHILGSLDDKIELNRQMNTTLEEMAQALFKSWFVDFDPVIDNAIVAGNPIPEELEERAEVRKQALADGTANREAAKQFPAAFQMTEELGWIPEGWEDMPFKSFTVAKTARVNDKAAPEYSSTNEGLFPRDERFKKQLSKSKSNNKLIHYGDLVFGMSRQVLNFGLMHQKIGSVSSAYHVFQIDESKIFPEFVESYIKSRPNYYYGVLGASSREGQSLSKSNFNSTSMLIPGKEVQEEFQKYRETIAARKLFNSSQSDTLTNLRDTLLPKLISGELRIPDAEKLVEEAEQMMRDE
jgi:type I restriction enzyme S subunit